MIIGSIKILGSKIIYENQSYPNGSLHSESKNLKECLSYTDDNQTELEN